jgi:hypothetical protein
MRPRTFLATTALATAVSFPALAADPAAAQVLFDEGKRLALAHDYAKACPKFEESQRLDPGIGTLFHFADCEEHLGKTATAWASFLEVAAGAKLSGEAARERVARDRAAAIEPSVPRLTIDAGPSADATDFAIVRDGAPVGRAQWGTAVAVDPGTHVIDARAAGKRPWSTSVTLTSGARQVLVVPALREAPTVVLASAPPPEPVGAATTTSGAPPPPEGEHGEVGSGQRVAGVALGVLGIAALGVGGGFAIDSLVRHDQAQSHCDASGCDARGVTLRNDARTAGDVATVAFVSGGTLLLGGIITFATAPHAPSSRSGANARAPLTVAIGPTGAALAGTW